METLLQIYPPSVCEDVTELADSVSMRFNLEPQVVEQFIAGWLIVNNKVICNAP